MMGDSVYKNKKRNYIAIEPNQPKGYPSGKKVFYECVMCSGVVSSLPQYFEECECGNIEVDTSGGRMSVQHPEKMKIFKVS